MNRIEIISISHDGLGVGRQDEQVVFVSGALPGETVDVIFTEKKKKIQYAELISIVKAHPMRQKPPCEVTDTCGGCILQIANEALSRKMKTQIIHDAFERIGNLSLNVLPMKEVASPYRYRNKGVFHLDESGGQVKLGFYAKKSHELVPAADCLLFSETVNHLVKWLEEAITNTGTVGHIANVMIRESRLTGDIMVAFITDDTQFRLPGLVEKLKIEWPQVKSIWHNKRNHSKVMLGHVWQHLAGTETIRDAIGHICLDLSPASFFQVNNEQATVLYDEIQHLVKTTGITTLLDLYCGIGSIGLYVEKDVERLIGVETVGAAICDAKKNARALNVKHATFHTAKAEVWLPKWLSEGNQVDGVIVDPPRKGLDNRLREALIQANIPNIIYVSCNPATLARDCKAFVQGGYRIHSVQPIDLFPQTAHVETVALLSKLDVDKHIDVEIKLDELDLTSAESKATYVQIQEYVKKKFGFKVSSLYISQVKKKYGFDMRQNYNKSKKEDQVVPQCPEEKEKAIVDALKHFKMI